MSLFRYNPEIHDNPEFQWPREASGGAPPSPLATLLSARNRAYSPLLSQLLQADINGTARGTNQAQVPSYSFDAPDQPGVTPAQYLGPIIEAIKPGFEFGMETLGARKQPFPPGLPERMTRQDFGEALKWGDEMQAKRWAEDIANDPAHAGKIVQELQKGGITKDMIRQWGEWYGKRFQQYPSMEQFWWRSQGLKHLHDRFPSTPPASTQSFCSAPGSACM